MVYRKDHERKVASLHTEIWNNKQVKKREKAKENQQKLLIFAGQNQVLYPHIQFKACKMKTMNL